MEKESPAALLLVDIQQGFEDIDYWGGARNNPQAEHQASLLLNHWRFHGWPLFHIKHNSTNPESPLYPGKPGNEIHPAVAPLAGETVIEKSVNSGFIGTDLEARLKAAGITTVVIAGLTTDHCVSTTTRMAANLGFKTFLVENACATFRKYSPDNREYYAELIHDTAITSLHEEFATIVHTDDLID